MSDSDEFTGMYELLEAIEAVIAAADSAKREALARTIDAYHEDCPDDFHWALSAQSPTLLYHLLTAIDAASRPSAASKPRPVVRLVDRKPEGNAQEGEVFDRAMAARTDRFAAAVAAVCDFDRFASIVDVGGGDGTFLARILAAHPVLTPRCWTSPASSHGPQCRSSRSGSPAVVGPLAATSLRASPRAGMPIC
jgi:O-methyltransferase domain